MAFSSHRFEWYNIHGGFPGTSVEVGIDQDGSRIYLGRAEHEGDLLPAKVIPEKQAAYICHNGVEILKDQVEVLRPVQYVWLPASNGQVPDTAVPFGHTSGGETLFAGRANYQGSVTPGKVHPSHGCLYIAFNGDEIPIKDYEVLCLH